MMNNAIAFHYQATKGRSCVANKFIKAGSTILVEEPYAMVVKREYREVACAVCGKLCIDAPVIALSSDDKQRYCSEKCIIGDYQCHLIEQAAQKALDELNIIGSEESCRLILRIAAMRNHGDGGAKLVVVDRLKQPCKCGKENTFVDIQCLEDSRSSSSSQSKSDVTQTSRAISRLAVRANLRLCVEETEHLFFAIQSNAHQMIDKLGNIVALGLFPMTSMLNHSCTPNCAHQFVFANEAVPKLMMIASTDIQEGEEICYSYIPLYQSTTSRQAQLFSAYSFHCQCQRCLQNSNYTDDFVIDNCPENIDIDTMNAKFDRISTIISETGSLQELFLYLQSAELHALHAGHALFFKMYHVTARLVSTLAERARVRSGCAGGVDVCERTLRLGLCCGVLALGCINFFTKVEQVESGHIAHHISIISALLAQNTVTAPNAHTSVESDVQSDSDFPQAVMRLFTSTCGELLDQDGSQSIIFSACAMTCCESVFGFGESALYSEISNRFERIHEAIATRFAVMTENK